MKDEMWDDDEIRWERIIPAPEHGKLSFWIHHLKALLADVYSSLCAFLKTIMHLESFLVLLIAGGQSKE